MKIESPYLFVYGSLRKDFQSPAYEYMSKYFEFIQPATVQGVLSDMGDFPAATPSVSNQIVGEIYKIIHENEFSYAIGQLDDYEGVNEEAEKSLFKRELANVLLKDGSNKQAWMYWYCGDVKEKPIIESGDVLQYHEFKSKHTNE